MRLRIFIVLGFHFVGDFFGDFVEFYIDFLESGVEMLVCRVVGNIIVFLKC
jgi:hypothetical protein